YPKPTSLIKLLIKSVQINDSEFILDFFAGSGTTAHAVMQLNKEDGGKRKCISIQLPELTDEKSAAYQAGYKTIADIAKERIRRAGKKIAEELSSEKEKKSGELEFNQEEGKEVDTGFKVLKLSDSNFKQWRQLDGKDKDALAEQINLFVDPVAE